MKNQAFTLIELLVVVLIIGILAAIAVPKYELSVEKSRISGVYNLLNSVRKAEEIYFLANRTYTDNIGDLDVDFPYNISEHNTYVHGGKYYWRICGGDTCMYATRQWKDGFYMIEVYFPEGDFVCVAQQNTKAQEICSALGYTRKFASSNYTPGVNVSRMKTHYYSLPNSIRTEP